MALTLAYRRNAHRVQHLEQEIGRLAIENAGLKARVEEQSKQIEALRGEGLCMSETLGDLGLDTDGFPEDGWN